jgi:hypothetical protein
MAVQIPDSSGYGGLANTPLSQLQLYDKIMERVFEKDFILDITNSAISERITSCTQEVQILMDPEVGSWRPHTIGGEMIHNHISIDSILLKICYSAYLAFAFDDVTIHYTCNWDMLEDRLLVNSYESYVQLMRNFVLSDMISQVDPRNQGNHAGPHGDVSLGDMSAPLRITPTNLPLILSQLQTILAENTHWIPGKMFLVVPYAFKNIVLQSVYNDAAHTGDGVSILIDGKWPRQLMGFDVYETSYLPYDINQSVNKPCFYILAGHKDAYAYASDIIMSRLVKSENTTTTKYQMIAAWGGAMIYPKYAAVAYGYLDPEIQTT